MGFWKRYISPLLRNNDASWVKEHKTFKLLYVSFYYTFLCDYLIPIVPDLFSWLLHALCKLRLQNSLLDYNKILYLGEGWKIVM